MTLRLIINTLMNTILCIVNIRILVLGAIHGPQTYGSDTDESDDRSRVVYGSPASAETMFFLRTKKPESLRVRLFSRYNGFGFNYHPAAPTGYEVDVDRLIWGEPLYYSGFPG